MHKINCWFFLVSLSEKNIFGISPVENFYQIKLRNEFNDAG
jgi:hypothetical protein